jgi:hypothetical protein
MKEEIGKPREGKWEEYSIHIKREKKAKGNWDGKREGKREGREEVVGREIEKN